ncbi:uncharacterized protein LOC129001683 [Macrosteles quadrilineatus]|uniref:uncharacterized protein LOC129001683 n=1 Tax=Macrosteles quadrilineatus TaxID=74068 RepID=UPI0023E1EF3B|nr:uncharacterized protein LOC129001683 [Macrosteles quadrilineatus]
MSPPPVYLILLVPITLLLFVGATWWWRPLDQQPGEPPANLQVVTSEEDLTNKLNEANRDGKLVVIDFFAVWCEPCQLISPHFDRYAKLFPNVIFLRVDVPNHQSIAKKYNVEAMPTFKFIKNGDIKDTMVGGKKSELGKKLALHQ